MTEELKQMKDMMQKLIMKQTVQVKPCEFCSATNHKTDACPSLQEDTQAKVNAVGEFQNYNNHAPQQPQQQYYRPPYRQQHGGYTQTVSELKRDLGKLPSQTVPNSRGNITTLAVVDVDAALKESTDAVNKLLALNEHIKAKNNKKKEPESVPTATTEDISSTLMSEVDAPITLRLDAPIISTSDATPTNMHPKTNPLPLSFVQIRAPEGHVICNELENKLEARHEPEKLTKGHPLATSQEAPPGKCKDPGAFTVTCGVGETQIHPCLIDLGAAIHVMPYSLYCSLRLGLLKPSKLLVELGDKSCIRPVGLLEDLTIHVGDLVVPVDFYVLQMGDARNDDPPALILGRPFLFSTKTKIDMDTCLLSLVFGGKTSNFYIYKDDDRPCAKKPPDIVHTPYLGALSSDLLDETGFAARQVDMSKYIRKLRRM
ncbi:unnamed protein product [Rhodiola kirilowii]